MLQLTRRNIVELPFEVLEQAHWRPREVQLCCKYKPADSQDKEFRRLRTLWRTKEVNANFALDALLMCCTPAELARLASGLSEINFRDAYLFTGYSMALKKIIGVPDFVISDGENCILGEIKVSAAYEITQFTKYQTFAMLCRASSKLPSNLAHVLITQDERPSNFLSDYGKAWTPEVVNGRLELPEEQSDKVRSDLVANVSLLVEKLKLSSGPKVQNVMTAGSLLDEANTIIPTSVFSWKLFKDVFDRTTMRADLESGSERIITLGMGTFQIDADC